ncbi:hypothetical protein JCM5350_002748 [Sporobolomyces pararoseus]
MRPSIRVSIKPVPISSIPSQSLRLPPKPTPLPDLKSTSPTISKLLSRFNSPSPSSSASSSSREIESLPQDGRGLGGFTLKKRQGGRGVVPSNFRVEEWVPKRKEFEGVGKKHRDLLRRLRREA